MSKIVSASSLFHGNIHYWDGDGDHWDDNKGCLFAHYGPETTLKELVDAWVEDSKCGDLDDKIAWDSVSSDEIRASLVEMLSSEGKEEYSNPSGPCEFAKELDDEDELAVVAIVMVTIEDEETAEV
jgi:hypothetical protein